MKVAKPLTFLTLEKALYHRDSSNLHVFPRFASNKMMGESVGMRLMSVYVLSIVSLLATLPSSSSTGLEETLVYPQ